MTAHPIDSQLYGHLWGTDELRRLFDDEGRIQSWLEILAALAEAQAEFGIVPEDAARSIRENADVRRLDLVRVGELTRSTGHSTLGLIRCFQEILPSSAREWVYYGATVQDVSDTWTSIVLQHVALVLDRDLARAERAARRLAETYADTVMCGRTHGQPGLPITFGFKAAVWASEVARHRERVAQGAARWGVAQLGGALGTMEFWGEQALPLLDSFASRLGLKAPDIAWLTSRDRIAEFVGLLGMVTATLGKIGQEVYQLQRPELGEVREGLHRGVVGSITMPHKVNPEISEHLVTLARIVRSKVGPALEAMLHEHERDGRAWKAEWIFLPEACILTGATLSLSCQLLEELEIDEDRMMANLEDRGGYLMSEPVMRELSPLLGKHVAHELVHRIAIRGREQGVGFEEVLLAERTLDGLLSADEIRKALDPVAAVGSAPEFVRRVLAIEPRPS
jgi:adenylosuccinate lyase